MKANTKDVLSIVLTTCFSAGVLLLTARPLPAQTVYTYTPTLNGNSSNTWGSPSTGWSATPASGTTTELTFGGSFSATATATSVDNLGSLGSPFQLNILDLNGSNSTSFATVTYNIQPSSASANTLEFTSNGTITPVVNLKSNRAPFGANMTDNVSINAAMDGSLTFQGNGSAIFNFSGILSDGTSAGSIIKNGSSALNLSGSNIFTGGVTLNAGGLNINNASAIGTGTLTIAGGTIDTTSASAITLSTNNAQVWSGDFSIGSFFSLGQALNLGTGSVTLTGNRTITMTGGVAGPLTVGGVIDDGGHGYGLTLGGSPLINKGILVLGNSANTYSGATTLNEGTLEIAALGSLGTGIGANVTVANGAVLGANYVFDQTLLAKLTSGSGGVVALGGNTSDGNNLDFSAVGTNMSLGALVGTTDTYTGALTPQGTVYRLGGGGGNLVFNSVLGGSNSLVVGGSGSTGTVTLAMAGTYGGGTTIAAGSVLQTNLTTASTTAPFGSGSINLSGGTLGLGTAGTLASGQSITVSGNDITYDGQSTISLAKGSGTGVTLTANTLTADSPGAVLLLAPSGASTLGSSEQFFVSGGAPTVTNGMVAPNIMDVTNKDFVTYSGVNGFSDAVTTTVFGANNIVKLSSDPGVTATAYALILNGPGASLLSSSDKITITGGGFIYNGSQPSASATINFGNTQGYIWTDNPTNFSVNFIGTGGVVFDGTDNSIIPLTGITGGITIAGSLLLNDTGIAMFNTVNPNTLVMLPGSILNNNANTTETFASISGSGQVASTASSASYAGTSASALGINGQTGTGTTTFSGNLIAGNGSTLALSKNGSTTQIFTGADSVIGTTTIVDGTLTYAQAASLGVGAVTVDAGATLNLDNSLGNVNRLDDGSAVALGGNLNLIGNASAATSETTGTLSLLTGAATVTLTPGSGRSDLLTFASLGTRAAGSTVLFRGTGLSSALGSNTSNIIFTTAPTVATTGAFVAADGVGTLGTTNAAIIRGALIDTSATGGGIGFATYDPLNNGVRLLNATTEQTTTYPGSTSTANVRLALTGSVPITGVTSNSLQIDNTSGTGWTVTNGGSALNPANGLLFTGSSGITLTGGTFTGSSSADTIILSTNTAGVTINTAINNSGSSTSGITIGGSGNITFGSTVTDLTAGSSGVIYFDDTGTVTVDGAMTAAGGMQVLAGTVQLSGASARVPATNRALTIAPGATLDIGFNGAPGASVDALNSSNGATGGGTLTSTGTGAPAALTVGAASVASGIFSGSITGNLNLTKSGTKIETLTGADSYTGSTSISGGALNIQNNSALGTGVGATTSGVTVSSGAALQMQANISTTTAVALYLSGTGTSTNGALENVSGNNTYSGLVTLNAASNIGSDSGTLTLSNAGTITGSGFGLSLVGVGNGVMASGIGTGAGTLTKSGTGTWTLTGADSYTGSTAISAGALNIQNNSALGTGVGATTSGVTVSSGAALQTQGNISTTTAVALGLSGTGISSRGALENVSDTNTYSGLVTLNAASSIGSDAGLLTLSNTGTITGSGLTLTLVGAGSGSIASVIGTGAGGVTMNGTGTWTLNGANTYTGATTISGGVLSTSLLTNVSSANGLGQSSNAAGNLLITNGTLQYTGSGGSTDRLFTINGTAAGATATLDASGSGAIDFTNNGALAYGTANQTRALVLTGSNSGANTLAAIIADNGTGATSLTKSGVGTWDVSGNNTYSGVTTINGGVLSVSHLANGSAASGIGQSSSVAGNLVLNGGVLQYTGAVAGTNRNYTLGVNGGGFDASGTGALTVSGNMTASGSTGSQVFTLTGSSTAANTLSGTIANGTGTNVTSLTKSGVGTWVLTGSNTFTGGVNLNGGVLSLGGVQNATSGPLGGGTGGLPTGVITFNGGTLQFTSANTTDYSGDFSGNDGQAFKIDTNGQAITFNSGLMGNGSTLTLDDTAVTPGSLTLTSALTDYTGLTTVTRGELDLNINSLFGGGVSGDVDVNGGTLKLLASDQIASTSNLTISSGTVNFNGQDQSLNNLVNSGGTVLYGTGAVSITDPTWSAGVNTVTGQTTFGELTVSGGTNTVAAGGNLTVGGATDANNGGTDLTFSGTGSPNITLNSDNSTPGVLTLAGNVYADNTLTSGTASITSAAGGTMPGQVDLGGVTRTFTMNGNSSSGVDLNVSAQIFDGGLTKAGAGTLELSGSNTYTGATTVSAGKLWVSGSLASGSAVTVNGGTLSVSGTVGGTVEIKSGATLSGNGGTVGALTIDGGGIINLQDASIGTLHGSTLTLGSGSNGVYSLDIGSSGADLFALSGAASLGSNLFTVNLDGLGSIAANTTYTILSASGGLSPGDFTLGSLSGTLAGDTIVFGGSATDLTITINPTVAESTNYYFTGGSSNDFLAAGNYKDSASGGSTHTLAPSSTSDVYIAANSPANLPPTVGSNVTINSLTFTSDGAGSALDGTGTVTLAAASGAGITDNAGGTTTETVNAPVGLGADQTWTVSNSGNTLTDAGGISGTHTLALAGPGTFNLTSGSSTYSGGTTVQAGARLLINNTTGTSALGTGPLVVQQGATFGGAGKATGLPSFAFGSGGSGTTLVQVGNGNDATSSLTVQATTASIASTNLSFNLDVTSTNANTLNIGSTALDFGSSVTFTLNLQGVGVIAPDTAYTLVVGTAGTGSGLGQYSGLTLSGPNNQISGINLVFSGYGNDWYGAHSYLFLVNNGNGTDDIEVEVVPEPSTWALILGGFLMLVVIQYRRNKSR